MERESFSVLSPIDELELHGEIMYPEGKAKAVLQLVHGMCEHKERYFSFMEYLAKAGYATVIYDHRGHGESIQNEKDLGYFYREGKTAIVEDAYAVTKYIKKICAEKEWECKFFLLGHSMGSMIVRCYLQEHDSEIDGLLVLGCVAKRIGAASGSVVVKTLEILKGEYAHSKLLDRLSMHNPYERPFLSENLSHAWICTNRDVVEQYNEDPRCNFTFTVNGYSVLTHLMRRTYSKKRYKVSNPELPIYFLAGEDDPCIGNKRKFAEMIYFMKKIGYRNVKGHLFENMRHEILNETKKDKVYQVIRKILDNWN